MHFEGFNDDMVRDTEQQTRTVAGCCNGVQTRCIGRQGALAGMSGSLAEGCVTRERIRLGLVLTPWTVAGTDTS